jgi:hypothetical protein
MCGIGERRSDTEPDPRRASPSPHAQRLKHIREEPENVAAGPSTGVEIEPLERHRGLDPGAGAGRVVLTTAGHIRQHFVRVRDLPVPLLRHTVTRIDAGMISASQPPEGPVNLSDRSGPRDTEK